jgi:hypothetical protein
VGLGRLLSIGRRFVGLPVGLDARSSANHAWMSPALDIGRYCSSSRSALASTRSGVSNPSVNQW